MLCEYTCNVHPRNFSCIIIRLNLYISLQVIRIIITRCLNIYSQWIFIFIWLFSDDYVHIAFYTQHFIFYISKIVVQARNEKLHNIKYMYKFWKIFFKFFFICFFQLPWNLWFFLYFIFIIYITYFDITKYDICDRM